MKSYFCILLVLLYLMSGVNSLIAQVIFINEIQASNQTTIADEDGEFVDWVELYNPSDTPVSLEGWHISDDSDNLVRWSFPAIHIPANGYLIIFCSDKDRPGPAFLHTNFKLSSAGEPVLLTDPEGTIIDQFPPAPMDEDESFGRINDGLPDFSFFTFPTPGGSNNYSNHINWSHEGGFYDHAVNLELSLETLTDTIYYTLDGKAPGSGSLVYSGPLIFENAASNPDALSLIPSSPSQELLSYPAWSLPAGPVEKAWVVSAVTYRNGQPTSRVERRTFFVDDHINSRFSLPVISLIVDPVDLFDDETGIYVPGNHFDNSDPGWTGNYFMSGRDWERTVHIEFFDKAGNIALSQNAGLRIHGGKTRQAGQKSFRLYARSEYGKSHFEHQIFPQKEKSAYKRLIVRTPVGSWTNDIFKDVLIHRLVRRLDIESQDYQPVSVFINGEYWGLYTLRDFLNEHHLSDLSGVDKDEINILGGEGWIIEGSRYEFRELLDYIEANDLSDEVHYDFVKNKIDIDNFIDYHVIQTYFRNVDWPDNNNRFWKANGPEHQWRWLLYDLDAGFGEFDHPTLTEKTLAEEPPMLTLLLRSLLKNETFKTSFYERMFYLTDSLFTFEGISELADSLYAEYLPEMQHQIDRWGFPASIEQWEADIEFALKQFARLRPCEIKRQFVRYFELDGLVYLCPPEGDLSPVLSEPVFLLPNPSDGYFQVYFDESEFGGTIALKVFDSTGKLGYSSETERASPFPVHLEFLPSGVYFFELRDADSVSRGKVIISK